MERLKSSEATLSLETNHLKIRLFTKEDITHEYVKALNDPEIMGLTESRYNIGKIELSDAESYVEKAQSADSKLIGIFLKDNKHIGNIRLHSISKENKRAELGIVIWDNNHWNKGYATESITAVCNYAFDNLDLHKIEAEYYANNTASAKMFEKAGFIIEGTIKDHFLINGKYIDAVRIALFN